MKTESRKDRGTAVLPGRGSGPSRQTAESPRQLRLKAQPGQSLDQRIAQVAMQGIAANASVAVSFGEPFSAQAWSLTDCAIELKRIGDAVASGEIADCERLLAAQASALNWVFAAFAQRAAINANDDSLADSEIFLRLALRAQGQCRVTIETLANMKRPRHVAFVAQTNVQVNNGGGDAVHGRIESPPTELLETAHEQRMDSRAPSTSSDADPHLAAVAPLDGPPLGRGQGRIGDEPVPRRDAADAAVHGAAGPRSVRAGRRAARTD